MKIAIIGSGDVGITLAKGLAASGHKVMIGTRNTKKTDLKHLKKQKNVSIGSFAEAADFGEIIVLAVAWHATENVLTIIRPEVSGKIVIDVTNPLRSSDDETPELSVGFSISAGELVQQTLADSHVVKTLNTVNYRHMVHPSFKNNTPTMFLCGNNSSAKEHVMTLLSELGWVDIQDVGLIDKCRLLEPLAVLWIAYGIKNDTWNHAFSVIN